MGGGGRVQKLKFADASDGWSLALVVVEEDWW